MSLSLDGAVGSASFTGDNGTVTLTTTGSNEPIVVLVANNGGGIASGVTSAHLTFTRRAHIPSAGNLDEWTAVATGPLTAEVITVAYANPITLFSAAAFGVLGAPGVSFFDPNVSLPVATNTATTPTFSTTDAATIVYGAVRSSISAPTPGAGWTAIYNPAGSFFIAQYQIFSSAQAGTSFTATAGSPNGWVVDAIVANAAAAPTLTSIGTNTIAEGATGVAVVGTGFDDTLTIAIDQPAGVSVAQTVTDNSATSATLTLVVEPGSGAQLAFTDATYTTTAVATTTSGGSGSPLSITVTPPAGLIFQTLASINPTSSFRITAIPDLAIGDQLEAAGNSAGTSPIPTGLSLNSDATFQFANGDTPEAFWVRAYSGTSWGAWAEQSIAPVGTSGSRFMLLGVG